MGGKRKNYDEAVHLYTSGMSIQEVADFYAMSRQGMYQILKIRGVTFRPVGASYSKTSHAYESGMLRRALRRGAVKKKVKCELCGAVPVRADGESGIQGHHPDYNKPLDVLWLCPKCHARWHRTNKPVPKNAVSDRFDILGKRYGRWLVGEKSSDRIHGAVAWVCKCDCGAVKTVSGHNLRAGKSKSCGCLRGRKKKSKQTT